jgi:anaerobic ribonucleoside-triphosphate reductase activating protein
MDINNGPGICATLYVQGCSHHCKGCFNPETWDFDGGQLWNRRTELQFIEACKKPNVKNICILGGEPLDQGKDLIKLIIRLKSEVGKPIWLWTGYKIEDIVADSKGIDNIDKQLIITLCDVVIDGPFISTLKDNSLKYRGSSNQRVIDVEKSIKHNKIILYEGTY